MDFLIKGEPDWDQKINDNFTNLDTSMDNVNTQLSESVQQINSVNSNLGSKANLPTTDKTSFEKAIIEIYNLLITKYSKSDIQSLIGFADINKNLSKIDQTMLTDTLIAQIAGTTAINAVLANYGLTTEKIATGAVTPDKLSVNCNLFNPYSSSIVTDNNLNTGTFTEQTNTGYGVTGFIPIEALATYIINWFAYDTVFFFDSSKTKISYLSTSSAPYSFTSPNNAAYVRLCFPLISRYTAMLVKGTTVPSSYIPYGYMDWLKLQSGNYGTGSIPKTALGFDLSIVDNLNSTDATKYLSANQGYVLNNKIAKILSEFIYTNLFDKSTVTTGYKLNYPNDNLTADSSMMVSDYIPVSSGNYTLNIANYDTVFRYDTNKVLVDKLSLTGWGIVTNTISIPGNGYVRLSCLSSYKDQIMFVKGDTLPTSYVGHSAYQMPNLILDYTSLYQSLNPIYKKTALFSGDSICYGAGFTGGYALLVGQKNAMTYTNYGISGTTVAKKDGRTDSILERISTMSNTADYVIFEGGVNDAWGSVPLGSITSTYSDTLDETTFCGALESIFKQALAKWTTARIGYIIPHKMSGVDTYLDKAVEICAKWGIPCLDLRKTSAMIGIISTYKTLYTNSGDGVHPNQAGYNLYYVKQIEAWMKSL